MNASRIRVGVAVGFLGLALTTGTALAQEPCTASVCDTTTTTAVGETTTTTVAEETTTTTVATSTTVAGELGTGEEIPPGGETGGETGEVEPGGETVGAGGQAAPEGTLPFTGGDVAGLALIGAAAIGAGALLLRRSKTATTTA